MNLANTNPLTGPIPTGPLTLTAEQYQSRVGSMLSRVDKMELLIRGLIDEENKQERISELGGRIYDIAVPGRGEIKEAHPVFENIMRMRSEMASATKEKSEKQKSANKIASLIENEYEFYGSPPATAIGEILEEEPILRDFIQKSFLEGSGHYGNAKDDMDFMIDLYKKIGSNYGKREIEIKGSPAYTFNRFGLEPDAIDEPDYDTEYKKDEEGITYAHITTTEKKVYDLFSNIPYKLEETIEYSWDVDTYTDEYGDEVADDDDLGYDSADTKTSYKLVRK